MKKTDIKRMFQAIENDKLDELQTILDANPGALEALGEHNRLVRDKTPLMFAMQCRNFRIANHLLDIGANAAAKMPDGPRSTALSLCTKFAFSDSARHDDWVALVGRLIDQGANPTSSLWPALHSFGRIVDRTDIIQLLLDRGANPDETVGSSGSTARQLVAVNRKLYPPGLLALFALDKIADS